MNKPSLPTFDPSKPLPVQFPVSCGSKHREKESVDDGAAVVADVQGSTIQTQPKQEVFAPPPTEVSERDIVVKMYFKRINIKKTIIWFVYRVHRIQTDPFHNHLHHSNTIILLFTLESIKGVEIYLVPALWLSKCLLLFTSILIIETFFLSLTSCLEV